MTRARRPLPAAAVFDWDGTIVDTLPLIYRANVVVLGELGITLEPRRGSASGTRPTGAASYRELGVPEDRWDAVAARWSEEMQARTAAGAPVGPRRASAAGAPRRSARARDGVDARRGRAQPATAQPRRTCSRPRTSPTTSPTASRTRRACCARSRTSASDPADAIYVGDTTVDLEMAAAAGTPFAAVAGTTSDASFRAAGVDRIWPGVGEWVDDMVGRRERTR